jgi:hypothetical protein
MKKKLLVSTILALTSGMAFAQGQNQSPAPAPVPPQGQLSTTVLTTTTATGEVRTTILKPRVPAAAPLVPTEGVVQAAIRQGNAVQAVQLINPLAPARYGNGQEHVMHDPDDPGKPKGISLFAWSF